MTEYQQPSSVLPYCIYHWTDKTTNTYRSLLLPAEGIDEGNGELNYHCLIPAPSGPNSRWTFVARFYAINPGVTPIPSGTVLFCAKLRDQSPHDTISVEPVYDPYDLEVAEGCVFFIAYSRPTPGTVPLYIYSKGSMTAQARQNRSFISFAPNAPPHDSHVPETPGMQEPRIGGSLRSEELTPRQTELISDNLEGVVDGIEWGEATISPIYVLSPETFGDRPEAVRFVCNQGLCMPWSTAMENPDIYWAGKGSDREPKPLHECSVDCNQLIASSPGKRVPFSLQLNVHRRASKLAGDGSRLRDVFGRPPSVVVAVAVGLLVLAAAVVAYLILGKKK